MGGKPEKVLHLAGRHPRLDSLSPDGVGRQDRAVSSEPREFGAGHRAGNVRSPAVEPQVWHAPTGERMLGPPLDSERPATGPRRIVRTVDDSGAVRMGRWRPVAGA